MVTPDCSFINAIATAHPPHDIHGDFYPFIAQFLEEKDRQLLRRIIARSQIEHRYSCVPLTGGTEGFYPAGPGSFPTTEIRMNRYKHFAPRLAHAAARQIVDESIRGRITHLIIGSCTGFYAPGVDCDLIESLDLPRDISRRTIGFMGCYAGLSVLQTAHDIVRADPTSLVLAINVELSSLHFQKPKCLEDVLGPMQFADGCSAALISSEPNGLAMDGFESRLFPDHADAITWHITDQGFAMHLDIGLPRILREDVLNHFSVGQMAAEHWAIHPGGRAILDAVQNSLELGNEQMRVSRQILRDFGNMSSATIMFILQQILQNAMPGQNGIAIAFGPGLAMESMRFTAAARPARSDAQNAGNTRHNRAGPLGITATLPLA
jgi:predicted naringenin-chalcone synthase